MMSKLDNFHMEKYNDPECPMIYILIGKVGAPWYTYELTAKILPLFLEIDMSLQSALLLASSS